MPGVFQMSVDEIVKEARGPPKGRRHPRPCCSFGLPETKGRGGIGRRPIRRGPVQTAVRGA